VNCLGGGYVDTPGDDLTFIYQDVVVAIDPERQINNGEPHYMTGAWQRCGSGDETAIHVGSGTGYYEAILAHLDGPTGVVHAYEIESDFAQKAQQTWVPGRGFRSRLTGWRAALGLGGIRSAAVASQAGCRDKYIDLMAGAPQIS
jgi:hypothetical protein